MKIRIKIFLLIFGVLALDQCSKIWVKLHMVLGESIHIFDWFQILFIENPGMAFGMTIGSKLLLTLFRVALIGFIIYYMYKLVHMNYKSSYVLCISLILAGAIGNVIDSLFYGLIFSQSTPFSTAIFMPEGGGYAPFFQGKVVDMLYFPLFVFPDWIPFLGGEVFFSPIFNLADSAISVGVVVLFLFFRKDFSHTFDTIFSKKHNYKTNA